MVIKTKNLQGFNLAGIVIIMAPGQGFEPRQTDPESVVLPLHKPGIINRRNIYYHVFACFATIFYVIYYGIFSMIIKGALRHLL